MTVMNYGTKSDTDFRIKTMKGSAALLVLLERHHPEYSPNWNGSVIRETIIAVPDATAEKSEQDEFIVLEIPDFLPKNPERRAFPPSFWPILEKPMPSLKLILQCVSHHLNVGKIDIISQRRTLNLTYPRHLCYWLMRSMTTNTLPAIGRFLGGRDHTTILHGCRKINALVLSGDKKVMHDIASIKRIIESSLGE